MNKPGYSDQSFWLRIIFMVFFWAVLNIAISIFGILVFILTVIRFGSQYHPTTLNKVVISSSRFIGQIFSFLAFQTDEKPFPFQAWPDAKSSDSEDK